jgi:DegV family protein with EDD domain
MNLNAANTAIVLDSTSDFPEARDRYPNMRVVPLYVRFGEESFRDHVDIGSHDFYEKLKAASALPTTSQPTPQDFINAFEELADYDRVYALHLSAKLSGTFQAASLAAGELGGDRRIRLVDTETASLAVGMLALAIQRRLARGSTDEEIEELIDRFKRDNRVVFTVGTLEYLQKGGRIGRAQALAGTLLNVKPILSVADGEIVPIGKVRGRQRALEEFARVFSEASEDSPGLRTAIAHADAPEWIEVITDLVHKIRPQAEIELVENLGAVVGTHAGPGAVGFFWFCDSYADQELGGASS